MVDTGLPGGIRVRSAKSGLSGRSGPALEMQPAGAPLLPAGELICLGSTTHNMRILVLLLYSVSNTLSTVSTRVLTP